MELNIITVFRRYVIQFCHTDSGTYYSGTLVAVI